MSGLVKAKKYDWKDTNLAMFGSDTEKEVKKESAESEPAWEGAGQEVGLQIWRIVKFEVQHWPKEDYGKFFNGDSYIILNTYKKNEESEALDYDVHFWIGKNSSQDEYGTAAYKTVELDTLLDDRAVQHREVDAHESELFLSYFPSITIMDGGAESGFRHVSPEEYKTRLLRVSGSRKTVTVSEVSLSKEVVTSNDVFILDQGLKLWQYNGTDANKDERFKAMQYMQHLKGERGNADSEVLEESEVYDSHPFFEALTGEKEEDEDIPDGDGPTTLFRVSDASGEVMMDNVKEGDVTMDDLVSNDVFIVDAGRECFVWVGSSASPAEKKNGFTYAHKHLQSSSHPFASIAVIKEGAETESFHAALAA